MLGYHLIVESFNILNTLKMSNNHNITLTPNIEDEILVSDLYIKVKTPNLYYGEREKLEDWLI